MKRENLDASTAPLPQGGYAQAVAIEDFKRLVFVSGQIPVDPDGNVPDTFPEQAALAWANVDAQLLAAGMSRDDIVKVNIFLSDRAFAMPNREARQAYLGDRSPAMSVIICGIFDSAWLLEIEAIAAR